MLVFIFAAMLLRLRSQQRFQRFTRRGCGNDDQSTFLAFAKGDCLLSAMVNHHLGNACNFSNNLNSIYIS